MPVTDELSPPVDGSGAAWSWGDENEDNECAVASKDEGTLDDAIGSKESGKLTIICRCALDGHSDGGGRGEKCVNRPDSCTGSKKSNITRNKAE